VSTIQVKNSLVVAPLEVTPVIFFADGTEFDLAPVQLPETGVTTINVNEAIANVSPEMASHLSEFGSAALRYQYTSPGHVLGAMQILDIQQSLIFTNPFGDFADSDASVQTTEGLWWRRDPGVVGFVELTNITDGEISVSIQPTGSRGTVLSARSLTVRAHSTRMFDLDSVIAGLSGLENQAGGLRLQYNGIMGAIIATGGLVNESEGYSANMPFWMHDTGSSDPTSVKYASAGVMVGQPDPMMGFPPATRFSPYAMLRNCTSSTLAVSGRLNYMASGRPVSLPLPTQQLRPFETREVNFNDIFDSLGLDGFSGDVNLGLSFTGHAGDLVFATGSVDQTGTYVFQVEPQGVGKSMSKETGYWTVANGFDTMFSLWNPTSQAQDFMVVFLYGDGSGKYTLPIHLEGQASTMIDLAMLIAEQQPDPDGNLIPSGIQEGSVSFSNADGMTEWMSLVVSGGIFNVQAATCGSTCIYCCGFSSPRIEPNPLTVAVGNTGQMNTKANFCTGIPYILGSTWSSNPTSVATVSGGTVTGKSAGSATITAVFLPIVLYTGTICSQFNPVCPAGTPSVTGTATVVKATISSAKSITDGRTASFTVTPSGATPTSYAWSFTAPQGAANSPNVTFTPSNAASTTTNGHWFALPNDACAASANSVYTIIATANFSGGVQIKPQTTLTVNLLSLAGITPNPLVPGLPATAFDTSRNLWVVTGPGSLERDVGSVIIYYTTSSQFYNKTAAHENKHVAQWTSGMLSDLYLVSDLMTQLSPLTDATQDGLNAKISNTMTSWRQGQSSIFQSRRAAAEAEAYSVSDPIPPLYFYQSSCGATL